jgi:hypothetical protein
MAKSAAAINEWIRSQQTRLGIETSTNGGSVPKVTAYPGERPWNAWRTPRLTA